MAILDLANPTRFMSLTDRLLPLLWAATVLVLGAGLYLGLFVAPADNLQGETYRIIFIHVPAAWLSMFGYGMMAVSALGTLIWRHLGYTIGTNPAGTTSFVALASGLATIIVVTTIRRWL